mmetsp:Transcript_10173/g.62003  ORF Transcript_10173/g.62003 Transcript_10173/m.62003 type:complete len:208 (-) Transcript_10173:71-694(-)
MLSPSSVPCFPLLVESMSSLRNGRTLPPFACTQAKSLEPKNCTSWASLLFFSFRRCVLAWFSSITLAGHHGNPRTRTHTTSWLASGACSTVDVSSTGWVWCGTDDGCTSSFASSSSPSSTVVALSFLFSLPTSPSVPAFVPFVFVLVGVACEAWWVVDGNGTWWFPLVHPFPSGPLAWSASRTRAWFRLGSVGSVDPPWLLFPSMGA